MATIRRFEDIQAWQKARELVRAVYKSSSTSAFGRDYGLKDQMRRAAVSSMTNVAEGFARKTTRDFAHFLDVAGGSAIEVQSLLYVAIDIGYLNADQFKALYALADEVAALIGGFTSYLRRLRGPNE